MTRLTALATVLLLLLVACEGGENGDAEDAAAVGDQGEAGGPVEITVWFARDYIPEDEFASLEAEHNIQVTYDVRPGDDILPTLLQMREAGEKLPDLIEDDTALVPGYVRADLLLGMNDLVATFEEEDPELFELVHPSVWEQGTFDGEVYQAALISNYDLYYYDPQWFEEASVEPGIRSWEEVFEASQALKEARPDEHPYALQADPRDGITSFLNQLGTVGVPFDGLIPDLASEPAQYVLEWYQRMVDAELISPESIAWGQDEARGSFIGRRSAIIMEGLNTAADFTETPNYDFPADWAAMNLPISTTPDAEEGVYFSNPRGWSMIAETEHPYEASLVIRYLAETENAVSRLLAGSTPPRQMEALSSPEVEEFMPHFTPEVKEAFLDSIPLPPDPNFSQIEQILGELVNEMAAGTDETPAALAERYQAQLQELRE